MKSREGGGYLAPRHPELINQTPRSLPLLLAMPGVQASLPAVAGYDRGEEEVDKLHIGVVRVLRRTHLRKTNVNTGAKQCNNSMESCV
jgi:hypothetical protein